MTTGCAASLSSVAPASVPATVPSQSMTPRQTTFYRRNLPHLRILGSFYFVTWRIHFEQPVLTYAERGDIVEILRYFDNERYHLQAYVVMDDHVHVLIAPLGDWRLEDLVRSWKSYSANLFQRTKQRMGTVWQREYFDRIVRDEAEYREKCEYILSNPFKRWPEIECYEWVWAIGCEP